MGFELGALGRDQAAAARIEQVLGLARAEAFIEFESQSTKPTAQSRQRAGRAELLVNGPLVVREEFGGGSVWFVGGFDEGLAASTGE